MRITEKLKEDGKVLYIQLHSHARGVMTLIHKSVPFQVKNVVLTGHYIIRDFNCTLNPDVDRSTGIDQSHNGCRTIHRFIKDLGLVDIWREYNPQAKTYSCYSSTYQTYSRIDYFLISSERWSKIHNSFYDRQRICKVLRKTNRSVLWN